MRSAKDGKNRNYLNAYRRQRLDRIVSAMSDQGIVWFQSVSMTIESIFNID